MPETRHASEKPKACDITGCGAEGVRSIPGKKVEKADMNLSSSPDKNAHLCREHYKEYKKRTRSERKLDRLNW